VLAQREGWCRMGRRCRVRGWCRMGRRCKMGCWHRMRLGDGREACGAECGDCCME